MLPRLRSSPPGFRTLGAMATAMVMGATGGLGSALAQSLAGGAYRLILTGRGANLGELGRKLNAEVVGAELSDELEVQAIMEQAGPLDLLLYAAGAIEPRTLRETGSRCWSGIMSLRIPVAIPAITLVAANVFNPDGASAPTASRFRRVTREAPAPRRYAPGRPHG